MKYTILAAFFAAICTIPVLSQVRNKNYQQIITNFIGHIKQNNKSALSSTVRYPLDREYPIPSVKTEQEFISRYNAIFDDSLRNIIIKSSPLKDWNEMGWRGLMLKDGMVWLDYDGKLLAVNYQSATEKKQRQNLLSKDTSRLYSSLRQFKAPVAILKTKKFITRIDDMGNGKYRYASWSIRNKMTDKPDLIITNGIVTMEGNGGNHTYTFTNGVYKYECKFIVIGEENDPPARLNITKGGAMILSLPATLQN